MPALNVRITGLEAALTVLSRVLGAIAIAYARAAARLSKEGTQYWRSIVRVRSGRMRDALAVVVLPRPGGVAIIYVVRPRGFYYPFQRNAGAWNRQLAGFLTKRAPQVLSEEIRDQIAKLA